MNLAPIAAGAAVLIALSASCAYAAPAVAVNDVKVRQGPGTNYRIVGTIPRGSTVEVSGCRSRWCTIMWPGGRGYAMAGSLVRGSAAPPVADGPPPEAYSEGPGPGIPPIPPPVYPPGAYPPGYGPPPVADYPGFEFGPYSAHYYGPFGGYGPYWPNRWWW